MGSGLTSLLFLSRTLSEPRDPVEKIRLLSGSLIQKMNEIIWTMEREHDSLESLISYIRVNAAETLENAEIPYQFKVREDIPAIPVSQQFRRNIYLVVKEAIHNVVRHSGATEVSITVLFTTDLQITIRDNGKGLDPGAEHRFGNGMKNMRHRMEQVRGSLRISSSEGVLLELTAPLGI